MNGYPIEVSSSGAILLGTQVCCDGFHADCRARVQAHIHLDHMEDFESSKGFQQILLSEATKRLLFARMLPKRRHANLWPLGSRQSLRQRE
jgi:hypothetical protein